MVIANSAGAQKFQQSVSLLHQAAEQHRGHPGTGSSGKLQAAVLLAQSLEAYQTAAQGVPSPLAPPSSLRDRSGKGVEKPRLSG
jgi:hypothetical protein